MDFLKIARIRIKDAWTVLRTGNLESFDELEMINQVMHTEGVTDRETARETVADRLYDLWHDKYPSEFAYWDEPTPSDHAKMFQGRPIIDPLGRPMIAIPMNDAAKRLNEIEDERMNKVVDDLFGR